MSSSSFEKSMPLGILIDSLSIIIGRLLGSVLGKRLPDKLKTSLTQCFGFMATGIGISLIPNVNNLGAVALSLILATFIGTVLSLDSRLVSLGESIIKRSKGQSIDYSGFSTVFVLFSFSANNFIGSFTEAIDGDNSILLCKAVLDFFTAIIFAANYGKSVSLIAVPQFIVCILCFLFAKTISSFFMADTMGDFKATSGVIMLMVGFKIIGLLDTKPMDRVLGLLLIVPISNLWQMVF